jgi:hypothetical protein
LDLFEMRNRVKYTVLFGIHMPDSVLPSLPLPAPLRGADAGTFAQRTVTVRIPEIGRRILAENAFSPDAATRLQALLAELPLGAVRSLRDRNAPDWAGWEGYLSPYLGWNWLEIPWFLAETYFYRRVLEASGYFQPGEGQGGDPYAYQKGQGLAAFGEAIRASCEAVNKRLRRRGNGQGKLDADSLVQLLRMNLWGNQADLSMWPAGQAERPDHQGKAQLSHLLCDHTSAAVRCLPGWEGKAGRVDIMLDNAGLELVHDLLLADALLSGGLAQQVRLHAKPHPTFVSDAIIPDILNTVGVLSGMEDQETRAAAQRLKDHLQAGALQLSDYFFWTSPLSMWEMPETLRQELGQAAMIISKGDANYRRLVGDRHWPFDAPLERVLDYLPTSLLALRVSKSQVMIGLQPGQAQKMDGLDAQWMTNGQWGVIQFYRKSSDMICQP